MYKFPPTRQENLCVTWKMAVHFHQDANSLVYHPGEFVAKIVAKWISIGNSHQKGRRYAFASSVGICKQHVYIALQRELCMLQGVK